MIKQLAHEWWKTPLEDDLCLRRAKWIWAENPNYDLVNLYALFRRRFHCDRVPASAPLLISADTSYCLYVNGQFVASGPARGYQHSWPYDRVEIGDFLRKGKNVLAVRAFNAGRGTFQYRSEGFAGLLLYLSLGDETVVTGKESGWLCRRQKGMQRDTVTFSLQLNPQEHIDLRVESPLWTELDYDDSDWEAPVTERSCYSPPWEGMEGRGIPMLNESIAENICFSLIGDARGEAVTVTHSRDALADGLAEGLEHTPVALKQQGFCLKADEGEYSSLLFDLGRVHVGRVHVGLQGCVGGEQVDVYFAECLNGDKLEPVAEPMAWNRVSMANRLVAAEGSNQHEFYHPVAFRYLVVRARALQSEVGLELALRHYEFLLGESGVFSSSEPELEDINRICENTQRLCALDAFVDTPWREQAQWWGDARIQGLNCMTMTGDVRLLDRGIRSISMQRTREGLTYGTAPGIAHGCVLPDFALTWIMTLWDSYWQSGEPIRYEENREGVFPIIDYFAERLDEDFGLVKADERYWLFLDWTDHPKDGFPAMLSLLLLDAVQTVLKLEAVLGLPDKRDELQELERSLRGGLSRLLDSQCGLLCEGLDDNGVRHDCYSVLAQVLGVELALEGLQPKCVKEKVIKPYLQDEPGQLIVPSLAFQTRILAYAIQSDMGELAVEHIRREWSPMIASGTTWELLNYQPGVQSLSHAWSAHPLHHLRMALGGLHMTAPGWREVIFAPCFYGNQAAVSIQTPLGQCQVSWHKSHHEVLVELRTPVDMAVRINGNESLELSHDGCENLRYTHDGVLLP